MEGVKQRAVGGGALPFFGAVASYHTGNLSSAHGSRETLCLGHCIRSKFKT